MKIIKKLKWKIKQDKELLDYVNCKNRNYETINIKTSKPIKFEE